METKPTSHIVKGLVLGLILVVLSLVGHLANIWLESWFGWVSTVVMIAGIVWSIIYYGKQLNNNVSFSNLFAHGFKTTAVIACVSFVFAVLSVYLLFPNMIDEMLEKGLDEARKKGNVNEDQLQQGMGLAHKIVAITTLAGSLIISLIIGAVASLIGAGIAKKNPQGPFTQPE